MDYKELGKEFEKIYNKKFKNSKCDVSTGCFIGTTLYINLFLANSKEELIGGIAMNDMFQVMFSIETVNDKDRKIESVDFSNEDLVLECCDNSYSIIPDIPYLAYGRQKVSFRKSTGNVDKILKSFEKFVDKLYDSVVEDLNNGLIHNDYIDLVKTKI